MLEKFWDLNSLSQSQSHLGDGSVQANVEVLFAVEPNGDGIHQTVWVFSEDQQRLIEDGDFGIPKDLGTRLDQFDLAAEETEERALV